MKILFMTDHCHLPIFHGGAEVSTDNLAHRCVQAGHEPAVLSSQSIERNWFAIKSRIRAKLSGSGCALDKVCGYPVYRVWDPAGSINRIVRHARPDIAVIKSEKGNAQLRAALAAHLPVVCYLRDIDFDFQDEALPVLQRTHFIANSKFTARVFHDRTGHDSTVIPPLVEPENYRNDGPGASVLFINPNPLKGLDVALSLAEQCPDIPFIFVESWGKLSDEEQKISADRAAKLRNIEWLKPTGDMKSLYARAKIVLAPTGALYLGKPVNLVEAWGRIATEAHFSGIPVIASNQGGLVESVGPGGILVDPNADISIWKAALRSLWDDPQRYLEVSDQALKYSQRPEIDPQKLFEDFISVCHLAAKEAARHF